MHRPNGDFILTEWFTHYTVEQPKPVTSRQSLAPPLNKKKKSQIATLPLSTHNIPFLLSFTLLFLHENLRRGESRFLRLLKNLAFIWLLNVFCYSTDILPPTICAAVGKHPVQLSLFDPQPSTVCSLLKMEGTQTTTREEGTTERNGDQGTSSNVPMSSKPLHRFVRKEPRSLGVTHQISKILNKQIYARG